MRPSNGRYTCTREHRVLYIAASKASKPSPGTNKSREVVRCYTANCVCVCVDVCAREIVPRKRFLAALPNRGFFEELWPRGLRRRYFCRRRRHLFFFLRWERDSSENWGFLIKKFFTHIFSWNTVKEFYILRCAANAFFSSLEI